MSDGYQLSRIKRAWIPDWFFKLFCGPLQLGLIWPFKQILMKKVR